MTKPLLICDADEVLLHFALPFGTFLDEHGYTLALRSFALTGNITARNSTIPLEAAKVSALVEAFFADRIELCPAVEGAADALQSLAEFSDIVILTNIAHEHAPRRAQALADLGMPYPVVSNQGAKGPAVQKLCQDREHPIVFIDDMPHHHHSVAKIAPHVQRVHFIASPALQAVAPEVPAAHARFHSWAQALPYLQNVLQGSTFQE
jgi:hypothetical protein